MLEFYWFFNLCATTNKKLWNLHRYFIVDFLSSHGKVATMNPLEIYWSIIVLFFDHVFIMYSHWIQFQMNFHSILIVLGHIALRSNVARFGSLRLNINCKKGIWKGILIYWFYCHCKAREQAVCFIKNKKTFAPGNFVLEYHEKKIWSVHQQWKILLI